MIDTPGIDQYGTGYWSSARGAVQTFLRTFDAEYRQLLADTGQADALLAQYPQIQHAANVSHYRLKLTSTPGFDALRAIAFEFWAEELTISTCRRIAGRLISASNSQMTVADAEKLLLTEVVERLRVKIEKPPSAQMVDTEEPTSEGQSMATRKPFLPPPNMTREEELNFYGFKLSDATVVPNPIDQAFEHLRAWANIPVVGGKFQQNWWELVVHCRSNGISLENEQNQWLPIIRARMRLLFDNDGDEDQLLNFLYSRHQISPTEAKNLSLKTLSVILQQPAQDQTTGSKSESRFAASSGETSENELKAFFKRDGENWSVRFGNERGSFKPIDGLAYIARMLENPGRKFSAEDLKRLAAVADSPRRILTEASEEVLDGRVGMTRETYQKSADKKTVQACSDRLLQIGIEREAARETGDINLIDDLDDEETRIKEYITSAQDERGHSRSVADSQRSMFNSVKQAIDRAVKKFASARPPLPKLYEHLSASLDYGNGAFEYRPLQPTTAWEL